MNNSDIIAKTFELKDKLVNSDLYIDLKKKEQDMLNNEECFKLLNSYQEAQTRYNDAKRFEKYGGDVASASKELSDIKCLVENNELVKAYNESYNNLRKELKRIEKILFKDVLKERKEIDIG